MTEPKQGERISEAELLEIEAKTSAFGPIIYGPGSDSEVRLMLEQVQRETRLAAEIRRYRELLLKLEEHGAGDQQLDDNPDALETCHFCGEYTHDPHKPDCVWAPVEAEAKAIRDERRGLTPP